MSSGGVRGGGGRPPAKRLLESKTRLGLAVLEVSQHKRLNSLSQLTEEVEQREDSGLKRCSEDLAAVRDVFRGRSNVIGEAMGYLPGAVTVEAGE